MHILISFTNVSQEFFPVFNNLKRLVEAVQCMYKTPTIPVRVEYTVATKFTVDVKTGQPHPQDGVSVSIRPVDGQVQRSDLADYFQHVADAIASSITVLLMLSDTGINQGIPVYISISNGFDTRKYLDNAPVTTV